MATSVLIAEGHGLHRPARLGTRRPHHGPPNAPPPRRTARRAVDRSGRRIALDANRSTTLRSCHSDNQSRRLSPRGWPSGWGEGSPGTEGEEEGVPADVAVPRPPRSARTPRSPPERLSSGQHRAEASRGTLDLCQVAAEQTPPIRPECRVFHGKLTCLMQGLPAEVCCDSYSCAQPSPPRPPPAPTPAAAPIRIFTHGPLMAWR